MIKNRIRVERGEFGDGDDETTVNAALEQTNNTNNSTPRRQTPSSDSRCKMSPNGEIIELTNMSRRQALWILDCDHDENPRETRRKHMMLVRKHHPDKWRDVHEFSREDGMKIFKGIANACEVVSKKLGRATDGFVAILGDAIL